jgi:hypothetical protein
MVPFASGTTGMPPADVIRNPGNAAGVEKEIVRCPTQVTLLVPLLSALALVTTTQTSTARDRDPWDSLRRPLQLEPLALGAACPVSVRHPLDRGHLAAVGVGPVFPMPSPFDPDDRHAGWIGSKTIWAWPSRLRSRAVRVLVRGRRLDGPGPMRFQLGPQWDTAPHTRELHIETTQTVGSFSNSNWGTTVTMLFVRTPGCYGLQLDSERGTSVVVVRA